MYANGEVASYTKPFCKETVGTINNILTTRE